MNSNKTPVMTQNPLDNQKVNPVVKPIKPVAPVAPTGAPGAPTAKPVAPGAPTAKPVAPVAPTAKPVAPVAPTVAPVAPVAPTGAEPVDKPVAVSEPQKSLQKTEDNEVIQKVIDTFKNSENIGEALQRLANDIPITLLLNFFDKYLTIIESVLARIQDKLGLDMELKDPEQAMIDIKKNLPKVKFRLLVTGVILKEMIQDPELLEVWGEFIKIFQNKFFRPFLIASLATLKEFEPQIRDQGEELEDIIRKVINRTGDAAVDAMNNVVCGIPYVGTIVCGIGAVDNIAKMIIPNVEGWGVLFLDTSYRLSVTLQKVAPQALAALDGIIEMVINAHNTYTAVVGTIDKYNSLIQGLNYDPKKGMTPEEVTNIIKSRAKENGTISSPPVNTPIVNDKPVTPSAVAKPTTDKPTTDKPTTAKPPGDMETTVKTVSGGGSKTRKKRRKKRTKKKTRKHLR